MRGVEFTLYEGIVIQNNDPSKMGRVKVFVPGISNTIYENFNDTITDKEFSGIDGDLLAILGQLKEDLPWAYRATTIFGGDNGELSHNRGKRSLERPSDDKVKSPPSDSFGKSVYTPADYSDTCGGLYSIPSVGSHVYVFFKLGNTSYPVYFASSHGIDDYSKIFKDNYPSDYENEEKATESYTNKHVLNTSKHSLEFIDSDGIEAVNLSHFSGSNIQFLNEYVSKYCVKDDLTLIEGDKYETVKKNIKLDVGETINITVGSGVTITVNGDGTINVNADTGLNITTPTTKITGELIVTGNIIGQSEVRDATRTMSGDRTIYNSHFHPTAPSGPISLPSMPQ